MNDKTEAQNIADSELEQAQGGVTINHDHMTTGGQVAVQIDHNHMPGVDAVNINNEYSTDDEVSVNINNEYRMSNTW